MVIFKDFGIDLAFLSNVSVPLYIQNPLGARSTADNLYSMVQLMRQKYILD